MSLDDEVVVLAESQSKGRGQMGTSWHSQTGKSLTFSIFKRLSEGNSISQANVGFAVALGIKESLDQLNVPEVSIKWPNDILSYSNKLCGVLVENQWQGDLLKSSVIGIGLNVNEDHFDELPSATSMFKATNRIFDRQLVLRKVVDNVLRRLNRLETASHSDLKMEYESHLFAKDKISVFETESNNRFNGIIRGVDKLGLLKVELEDDLVKTFEMKEIRLLY